MFEHLKNKKLYRSPKDALVFGVAAGLAQYLQVDVVFVRLALVALAFLSGWWPMLVVYIVGVILMPVEPSQETVAPTQEPKDVTPKPEPVEHMDRSQNA
jgi:phage shock protein PspC (stress-responsive transcriptional regulator)